MAGVRPERLAEMRGIFIGIMTNDDFKFHRGAKMAYSIIKMRWNIERMAAKSKKKMITLST